MQNVLPETCGKAVIETEDTKCECENSYQCRWPPDECNDEAEYLNDGIVGSVVIDVALETLLQFLSGFGKGKPAEKLCRRPWRLCPVYLQYVAAGLAAAACILLEMSWFLQQEVSANLFQGR